MGKNILGKEVQDNIDDYLELLAREPEYDNVTNMEDQLPIMLPGLDKEEVFRLTEYASELACGKASPCSCVIRHSRRAILPVRRKLTTPVCTCTDTSTAGTAMIAMDP
jgi:hypothetical protein